MALDNNPIKCPLCGGDYLHHEQVDVFNRNAEDSHEGIALMIHGGGYTFATNAQDQNPSPRRNGIRITLWCEGCSRHSSLTLIQHKGQTFIEWE